MIEPTPETPKQRSTIVRMLPGILVSAAAVTVLALQIDFQETWGALQTIPFWRIVLAFGVLLAAFFARSQAWRITLRGQASLPETFSATGIGYLLNQVLPFRLGEVARTIAISMRTPVSFWEAFPTVVIERIFDLGFLALFLFITLPFAVGASWAGIAAIVAAALVVAGFGVLYGMVLNPGWVQGVYGWISGRWPKMKSFGEEKIDLFLRGLAVLRDPKRFFMVLFWIGVTWGLTLLWNSIILVTFYPQPSVLEAAFIVGVAAVGVAAPSTPGNLGVYEAAVWSAYLALGADPDQGMAFALATHGIYIVIVIVLGALGLLRTGISLKEIYRLSKDRRT